MRRPKKDGRRGPAVFRIGKLRSGARRAHGGAGQACRCGGAGHGVARLGIGAAPAASIQARPCSVAWRAASSRLPNTGCRRITRSCVMLPRPERMDTAADQRSGPSVRMIGEIRYFPTWRELAMTVFQGPVPALGQAAAGSNRNRNGDAQGLRGQRMVSIRRGVGRGTRCGPQATSGSTLGDEPALALEGRSNLDLGASRCRHEMHVVARM